MGLDGVQTTARSPPKRNQKWNESWRTWRQSLMATPMLRAVPSMMRMADSTLVQLRSGSLVLAISSSWERLIEPTLPLADSPEPLGIPAALVISTDAGGVLVMKVKLRSSKTEISTGITNPALSWVRALYSLQNAMMLTPC